MFLIQIFVDLGCQAHAFGQCSPQPDGFKFCGDGFKTVFHLRAGFDCQLCDDAVMGRQNRMFHFHGLDREQHVPLLHLIPIRYCNSDDFAVHRHLDDAVCALCGTILGWFKDMRAENALSAVLNCKNPVPINK